MCALYIYSAVVTFGKLDTSFFMEKSSTGTRVKYIESHLIFTQTFVEVSFFYYVDEANHH